MLDSVESVYRVQMAQTFLVALAANDDLPLIFYSFLDEIREDPSYALKLGRKTGSKHTDVCKFDPNVPKREIRMQKRLDARTKGLLEVSNTRDEGTSLGKTVNFFTSDCRRLLG
jgi:hypothetical protein